MGLIRRARIALTKRALGKAEAKLGELETYEKHIGPYQRGFSASDLRFRGGRTENRVNRLRSKLQGLSG